MDRGDKNKYLGWLRKGIMAECVLVTAVAALVMGGRGEEDAQTSLSNNTLAI